MYPLRKSKQILRHVVHAWRASKRPLSKEQEQDLFHLDELIIQRRKKEADKLARKVASWGNVLFPKSLFKRAKEFIIALIVALLAAMLIRTMWFELYEIPTGSMRPTFEEHDHIIASKTSFGINVPLLPKHFFFEPDLVSRMDIVIFTVENIDVRDPDTLYFYIFPGKRLLVKRLIGKPGDTLYFYGGQIYGIDKDDKPLTLLQNSPWIQHIAHVPFISFEGREKVGSSSEFFFSQSGKTLAKLQLNSVGGSKGFVREGSSWVLEDKEHRYTDFFGMKNYAMARLLSAEEVAKYTPFSLRDIPEGVLYLELSHLGALAYPQPLLARDGYGNLHPILTPLTSIIPLQKAHLDRLMDNLYTARFVVSQGVARNYSAGESVPLPSYDPPLAGVEDGTYEFYHGKGYKVLFGGLLKELPADHPLYNRSPKMVETLFNLGMHFNQLYAPNSKEQLFYPQRFAYFRDGSLFVMNTAVFDPNDTLLQDFLTRELEREKAATTKNPTFPSSITKPLPWKRSRHSGLKFLLKCILF